MAPLEIDAFPYGRPPEKVILSRGGVITTLDYSLGNNLSWGGTCALDESGGKVDVAVGIPHTRQVFFVPKDSTIMVKQGKRVLLRATHRSPNP